MSIIPLTPLAVITARVSPHTILAFNRKLAKYDFKDKNSSVTVTFEELLLSNEINTEEQINNYITDIITLFSLSGWYIAVGDSCFELWQRL